MGRIRPEVRTRIRAQASDRCGYCLSPQHLVLGALEIDHLVPIASGGTDGEANLWLARRPCNHFKGARMRAFDPVSARRAALFNPRRQRWARHFAWSDDGTHVVGRTAAGRATVLTLRLNHPLAVMVRREWVAAGWYPPRT